MIWYNVILLQQVVTVAVWSAWTDKGTSKYKAGRGGGIIGCFVPLKFYFTQRSKKRDQRPSASVNIERGLLLFPFHQDHQKRRNQWKGNNRFNQTTHDHLFLSFFLSLNLIKFEIRHFCILHPSDNKMLCTAHTDKRVEGQGDRREKEVSRRIHNSSVITWERFVLSFFYK